MIRTLKIIAAFYLVFLLHRIEAWGPLAIQYKSRSSDPFGEFLTGSLSDFWVATLLSLPFWPFDFFHAKGAKYIQIITSISWLMLFGVFTAAHQGYVEFFKFQIIPFHLTYLTDQSFVSSNGGSMFAMSSVYIIIVSLCGSFWISRSSRTIPLKTTAYLLFGVAALALTAHVLNIRWRVNWYIIEPLQQNYIEALVSNLGKKPTVKSLSQSERAQISRMTGQGSPLFWSQGSAQTPDEIRLIKIELEKIKKMGKPVIVGVILSESLRDIDTGKRDSDQISLTPNLDRLQENGVRFTAAYSSGPVTRGGQEAEWCGTPSATDTSLMRSFPDVDIKCIPRLSKSYPHTKTAWIHGGDERFDSQRAFWAKQGVDFFVTKSDFPSTTPATGWGISDLALFEKSATFINNLSQNADVHTIFPMILTVSNHIPWSLPADASLETKNLVPPHAAHKTVKYFDESLDVFVQNLKEYGLWDHSVFIVSGDHGNLEAPWRNSYESDPMKWERMLSHISLTLTGGIIENLRSKGQLPALVTRFTAQAQIAPFLSQIGGLYLDESKFMDTPLFLPSPWPITSDLNQYLFLPENSKKLPKEDVLRGNISESDPRSWLAATRHRAWLQYLYSGHSDPK